MKEKVAEFFEVFQGYRKFTVCLFVLVVGIIFRIKNLVNGSEVEDLLKAVSLGFFGSNVGESITTCIKEHLALRRAAGSLTAPPTDPVPAPNDEVEIAPEQPSGSSQ